MCTLLIQHGAREPVHGASMCAVTAAAKGGSEETVKLLMDNGFMPDPNSFIGACGRAQKQTT